MNTVKELLLKECDYPLSGEVMDRFLESAEELHLKRNEILIMSGKVDALSLIHIRRGRRAI